MALVVMSSPDFRIVYSLSSSKERISGIQNWLPTRSSSICRTLKAWAGSLCGTSRSSLSRTRSFSRLIWMISFKWSWSSKSTSRKSLMMLVADSITSLCWSLRCYGSLNSSTRSRISRLIMWGHWSRSTWFQVYRSRYTWRNNRRISNSSLSHRHQKIRSLL